MLDNIREKETLPVGDEDRIIPTKIAHLDAHLKFLSEQAMQIQEQIRNTQIDRELLIKRAKECSITTDDSYKIVEVPVYPKKRVDVEALRKYEDKYKLILTNIAERIKDEAAQEALKAESFISQADVKAVVRDKAILAVVIPKVKEPSGYEISVVKR